jgi:fumarate hydratase subunit beta
MKDLGDAVELTTPLSREAVAGLRAGQAVLLSGVVYTARDAAHKRMVEALGAGDPLPIPLDGQVIYYCGPAPAPPGRPIGSCGPTSSARMDTYLGPLLALGLMATIGKGNRSLDVRRALVRHGAVYLVAVGGAGALLAGRVTAARVVAYSDLGPEAIYELHLDGLPALVGYDTVGGTAFAREDPL